ncbi:zinc finger BED domain-containing protein 4-like [Helicoverpa zea]|uniref:zinc finger BED domain-containing protein 4-like n=1 Tax=Helicoverpa zea TaxID=7113 RepID=UPI001F58B410|nr:zinc finger BED domain-containing protein 4-like [Helicoverpa zea]XP_049707719.1 zinc finger BED domain-containing protein 4-like [Helicoverpa armigera]
MASTLRKTSNVWVHFDIESVGEKTAVCKLCRVKLSYKTSSTNLKKHILRKHPTVEIQDERRNMGMHQNSSEQRLEQEAGPSNQAGSQNLTQQSVVASSASHSAEGNPLPQPHIIQQSLVRQPTIAQFTQRKKITPSEQERLNRLLMKLFMLDFQPFSIVEDEGFVAFVHGLNPIYQLPSRKYLSNTLLPSMYQQVFNETKTKMTEEAKSVCLTTDCWTSKANESYMAITAHYIDQNYILKSLLLQCEVLPGHHTAINLAAQLRKCASTWNITDKITIVVSDNASNIVSAITTELNWRHFGCYAHSLNLIVKSGLSVENLQQTITKVKNIVSFYKRSPLATEKFVKYQVQQSEAKTAKKLTQSVETRWNSDFHMLQRFLELREAVTATLPLSNFKGTYLEDNDWKIIQDLQCVLKPFDEVSTRMSGEKYLTGGEVIPITQCLLQTLETLELRELHDVVKLVLKKLKKETSERFRNLEFSRTLALSTFLDPRFKIFMFPQHLAEETKKVVIELVAASIAKTKQLTTPTLATTQNSGSNTEPSIWNLYRTAIAKIEPKGTPLSRAIAEVQRYLDDDILLMGSEHDTPLQWWKNHEHVYPNLTKLVFTKCCVLATSVPCERVFSRAGTMVSERRTRLGVSKVKQLMFLNVNCSQ